MLTQVSALLNMTNFLLVSQRSERAKGRTLTLVILTIVEAITIAGERRTVQLSSVQFSYRIGQACVADVSWELRTKRA